MIKKFKQAYKMIWEAFIGLFHGNFQEFMD